MFPSASYIKWAVFFVLFLLDILGAGMCGVEKKSVIWFLNCFSTNVYQHKMPAILTVKFKMAASRTTASGQQSVVLVFADSSGSHGAHMVFYACKCFVFWSRRKDT